MTDFRPRRIAIVEDESVVALDLQQRVEMLGHTVTTTTSSAHKALEAFEIETPDLVLMDIVLEGDMDGIQAAEIIRSRWHVPVVFVTAHADSENLRKAKLAMPFGYLLKPIQDRDLEVTIEMALHVAAANRSERLLYEVSSLLLDSDSIETTFSRLPKLLAEHFEAPIVAIELYDENSQEMVFAGATGVDTPPGKAWRIPVDQTISGTVARTGEAVAQLDVRTRDDYRATELWGLGVRTFACVPVATKDRVTGTLAIADHEQRPDIVAHRDLLRTVANNLASQIERRRAEREACENATKHQAILGTAMDGFCAIGRDARILEVNAPYCAMSGYDEAELLQMKISGLEAVETATDTRAHLQRIMTAGVERFESRHRRKDGSVFDVEISTQYQAAGKGRFVAFVRDITPRKKAEEALRENESRLKKAQELANVGNWEYDVASGQVWGSEQAFRIYGLERRSEFLPLDEVERHIIDAQRVNQALIDLLAGESGYDIEFQIRPKDRKGLVTVRSVADLVRGRDGAPVKVVGVIQDISDLRRSEEERRKTEETHRKLLTGLNAGVVVHAPDTSIILSNPAACRLLGLSEEQMLGKEAVDPQWSFLRDDRSKMPLDEYPVNRVLSAYGPVHNLVVGVQQPQADEVVWVLADGYPRLAESGELEHIVISFVDITERKQAEEALRESEAKFRELADMLPQIVFETDVEGKVTFANQGAFEAFGYTEDDLTTGLTALQMMVPEDRDRASQKMREVLTGGIDRVGSEYTACKSDGTEFPVLVYSTRFIRNGKPAGLRGFMIDITDRKRAEAANAKLEEQLAQAQKMESVGRLAGGVAHDFNNMMGVVLGHVDMAMDELDPTHPVHDNLLEINKAAERATDLTRQLLAFARKQTVTPRVIDFNETVEAMLTMLHRLIGEHISLKWHPGTDVGQLRMDPSQLDQVLANLCVNARDAISDTGRIVIETKSVVLDEADCAPHAELAPGEYISLAVSDDGCGIHQDDLEHIFDPFFTTKGIGKGTGLGLATVYGIVKQNRGAIEVQSEPGQGTTLKIYLQRYRVKKGSIPDGTPSTPVTPGSETILLVEDELPIMKMSATMLEGLGYTVLRARTPGEALELAHQHTGHIHLLLTDVVMPEMNGRDVAKNLLLIYPDLKCLFMSGYTADVIAHHGVLDEGVQFIQKPFRKHDLAVKIREALDS